jgi:hypothetical protein
MSSRTWSGNAGTSDWTNGGNWQENAPPEDGDDIVIPVFDTETTPIPAAPVFNAGKLTVEGGAIDGGPITVGSQLQWSGGTIYAQIISTTGMIEVSDGDNAPSLAAAMQNAGFLSISGSGTLAMFDGGNLVNNGDIVVSGGVTFAHTAGEAASITNQGQSLSFTGAAPAATFRGGSFTLNLIAGQAVFDTSVEFAGGSYLNLGGGNLSGSGRILITDGGMLECASPATVAESLTLEMSGGLAECGDYMQLPVRLTVNGTLVLTSGTMRGRVHLAGKGKLSSPANNQATLEVCALVVENHLTIADGDLINGTSLELLVGGWLEVPGSATFKGDVTNVGYVSIDGTMSLVGCAFETTDSTVKRPQGAVPMPFGASPARRGAVVIGAGCINADGGSNVIVTSGILHLQRAGTAAEPTITATTVQVGAQGVLQCSGQLATAVSCDGRLTITQEDQAGLTLSWLGLSDSSRIELPDDCWTRDAPALNVAGPLYMGGVLALPTPANFPSSTKVITCQSGYPPFGRFDMTGGYVVTEDYGDEFTYLQLSADLPASVLGFDQASWPSNLAVTPQPSGLTFTKSNPKAGRWLMQNLYETTDLAFVGFYLAPTADHPDSTWMPEYQLLHAQGWGVAPFYVGKINTIASGQVVHATPAQIQADAQAAVTLATTAKLPANSVIIYDVESKVVTNNKVGDVVSYILKWCDDVITLGYQPGVYAPPKTLNNLRTKRPDTFVFLASDHGAPPPFDGYGLLQHVNLDANTDLAPPPSGWQWAPRWTGTWKFLDTTGVLRTFKSHEWDFDAADRVDPSQVTIATIKTYNTVSSVTAGTGTWKVGSQTLKVTLAKKAAQPNGALVLLESSHAAAQTPTTVTVPAGSASTAVQVDVHLVESDTAVTFRARTHRQPSSAAPSASVTISKP